MTKHDPQLDQMFQALSDPTRRAVFSRLMQGPAPVSELAQPFAMALPTLMGHLAKLEKGGLIVTEKQGRSRICRAEPAAMAPARDWIEDQRALWQGRLDRLEDFLETMTEDEKNEH